MCYCIYFVLEWTLYSFPYLFWGVNYETIDEWIKGGQEHEHTCKEVLFPPPPRLRFFSSERQEGEGRWLEVAVYVKLILSVEK